MKTNCPNQNLGVLLLLAGMLISGLMRHGSAGPIPSNVRINQETANRAVLEVSMDATRSVLSDARLVGLPATDLDDTLAFILDTRSASKPPATDMGETMSFVLDTRRKEALPASASWVLY